MIINIYIQDIKALMFLKQDKNNKMKCNKKFIKIHEIIYKI